jgi:multidrug efflux pump subunit AcrA (membrane-fusion protein)
MHRALRITEWLLPMTIRQNFRGSLSILLVFLSLMPMGCSRPEESVKASPDAPVLLSALQVQPVRVERKIDLVGTLQGQREVTLSSEVAARVIALHADLGDRVEQGQELVALNSSEFRMTVDRQQASLAQVLSQLGLHRATDPMPDPQETSIVRKAAADLADAKAAYERTNTLYEKSVFSKQLLDTSEARYKVAEANYTAALEAVGNLEAQVANMRAQLALAEKKVADCTIRAPFAGTVAKRLVEIGQYLREQTPVMSIVSTNPLKLQADVPERWFPYVPIGAVVELKVEAYPDAFPGRVARVSKAVDAQTRTFSIEAEVDNSRGQLRPGLFAMAQLVTSKADDVLRVPASAVISFYGIQKVYVIVEGEVRETVVKLGDRMGDLIEVTEGLSPGEWIATNELSRIRQGSRVQVKKES